MREVRGGVSKTPRAQGDTIAAAAAITPAHRHEQRSNQDRCAAQLDVLDADAA